MARISSTLALLASLAVAAPAVGSEGPWYRIEVVVFAYTDASSSTETWLPEARSYPVDLIAIGEPSPEPMTFEQLEDVVAHNRMLGESGEAAPAATRSRSTFLFESQSRFFDESTGTLRRQSAVPPAPEPESEALDQAESTDPGASPEEQDPQSTTSDLEALDAALQADVPTPYVQLDEDARQLRRTARSIDRSRRYRLLDHLLWAQPISRRSAATRAPAAILIEAGERHDEAWELTGMLTFSRARYLHVDTDLIFTAFAPTGRGTPSLPTSTLTADDLKAFQSIVEWEANRGAFAPDGFARMRRSQRLSKGEAHYIDHPYFGLLIRIDDYKFSASSAGESSLGRPDSSTSQQEPVRP